MKKIRNYVSQLLVAVMLLGLFVPTAGATQEILEETQAVSEIAEEVSEETEEALEETEEASEETEETSEEAQEISEEIPDKTVVIPEKVKEATVILSDLGFIDENDTKKDLTEPMSRAEFVVLLIRMRGLDDIAPLYYDEREFVDVNAEYYEDAFIRLATELGYVEETARGWFNPKQAVSYTDAIKGIVSVLGYAPYAEKNGGTDAAYLSLASQIKADKNAKREDDGLITRGNVYAMAADALDINILDADTDNAKDALAVEKGRTLLTAFHNIYQGDGIMTANQFTGLSGAASSSGEGTVIIGGERFNVENEALTSLLGYRISYYYREIDGYKTLLSANPYKTETVTVKAENIIRYSQRVYSYYDEENDEYEKINTKGGYMIYNGVSAEGKEYTAIPVNGEVTFIDNDGDGDCNVCLINSYDEYVVKRTDADREMIYGEYGKTLDLSVTKKVIMRYADTTQSAEIGELKAGYVISVCEDLDNRLTQILISEKTASGTVKEKSTDETVKLTVEDVKYSVSNEMLKAIDDGKIQGVTIGRTYTFSLNHKGEIAYYNSAAGTSIGEYEYGILTAASKGKGINKDLTLKIFTTLGMFEYFKLGNKVYIDEKPKKDMEEIFTELCKDGEKGEAGEDIAPQLIRFRINKELEVTHIDRAGEPSQTETGLYFSYDLSEVGNGDGAYYNSDLYGFSSDRLKTEFTIPSNPIVFSVPMQDGKIVNDNDNSFILEKGAFANGVQYKTIFYKTDPKLIQQEVVLLANDVGPTGETVKAEADIRVFIKAIQALDNEGSPATKVYYSLNGGQESIFTDSSINVKAVPLKGGGTYALKPGDLFRYNMDATGKINAIEAVYDCENDVFLSENVSGGIGTSTWHPNTTMYLRRLNVHTVSKNHILSSYAHPSAADMTDISTFYIAPTTNKKNGTFEYDRKTNTVRKITYKDIFDYAQAGEHYSKGFYWSRYSDTRTVIIYK